MAVIPWVKVLSTIVNTAIASGCPQPIILKSDMTMRILPILYIFQYYIPHDNRNRFFLSVVNLYKYSRYRHYVISLIEIIETLNHTKSL